MLRPCSEFQEEIARLRARLAEEEARARSNATTTVMVDGKEVVIPVAAAGGAGGAAAAPTVVEKIVEVERLVEVEKRVGISEEEMRALQEAAEKERAELLSKAAEEQAVLVAAASKTEEERRKLAEEVASRAEEQARALAEKEVLAKQLTAMQEKLLIGGQVLDKAAKQEEELRRAQVELEERKRQEEALARELEEANLMIEEQYASMAEEVEVKTRKLKKVWHKLQASQAELRDATEEFAREREDMLDTIRELNKQLKLKSLLLEGFVPPHEVERLEARAVWDEEADEWSLRGMELAGNRLRVRRPPSSTSAAASSLMLLAPMADARPRSQYAMARAAYEPDHPRFRTENLAALELEMPPRTTEDFGGPAAGSKIKIASQVRAVMRSSGTLPQ